MFVPVHDHNIKEPWKKYENDLIALTPFTTPYEMYFTSSPKAAKLVSKVTSIFFKPRAMFRYQV